MLGDLAKSRDQRVMSLYAYQGELHLANFGGHSHSGCNVIMILVCLMISQNLVIKRSCNFIGRTPLMVIHQPHKFDSHCRCASGDLMFSVAEEEDSRCSSFNPPLLFISKGHGLKAHGISY